MDRALSIAIRFFCLCTLAVWSAPVHSASAEGPRQKEQEKELELRFGMSAAFSGPAANLGRNMRAGILAAFNKQNARGGIAGRRLTLISRDDRYEPEQTVRNTLDLIEKEQVLAFIGNVGTPTSLAAVPILRRLKVSLFAPLSGSLLLREAVPQAPLFHLRASYQEEIRNSVEAILQGCDIQPEEIALFSQRDGYGDDGYKSLVNALKSAGFEKPDNFLHIRYERNSLAVENAVAEILLHPARIKAIILVAAYAPAAKFVRLLRQAALQPLIAAVSFIGTESFAQSANAAAENVLITQIVPHYLGDTPFLNTFREDLNTYVPQTAPNYISLEGYIAGLSFLEVLKGISPPFTRAKITHSLRHAPSISSFLSAANDQAKARQTPVWLSTIQNGTVLPAAWDLAFQCETPKRRP